MEQLLLILVMFANFLAVLLMFLAGMACLCARQKPKAELFYRGAFGLIGLYGLLILLLATESAWSWPVWALKISVHLLLWMAVLNAFGLMDLLLQAASRKRQPAEV